MRSTSRPFTLALALAIPSFVAAFALAGRGHAAQWPLVLIFPFGPLVAIATGFSHLGGLASMVSGVAQYPLYALVLRAGARSGRLRMAATGLFVSHLLAVVIAVHRMF